jgi:hypothetical protein
MSADHGVPGPAFAGWTDEARRGLANTAALRKSWAPLPGAPKHLLTICGGLFTAQQKRHAQTVIDWHIRWHYRWDKTLNGDDLVPRGGLKTPPAWWQVDLSDEVAAFARAIQEAPKTGADLRDVPILWLAPHLPKWGFHLSQSELWLHEIARISGEEWTQETARLIELMRNAPMWAEVTP